MYSFWVDELEKAVIRALGKISAKKSAPEPQPQLRQPFVSSIPFAGRRIYLPTQDPGSSFRWLARLSPRKSPAFRSRPAQESPSRLGRGSYCTSSLVLSKLGERRCLLHNVGYLQSQSQSRLVDFVELSRIAFLSCRLPQERWSESFGYVLEADVWSQGEWSPEASIRRRESILPGD